MTGRRFQRQLLVEWAELVGAFAQFLPVSDPQQRRACGDPVDAFAATPARSRRSTATGTRPFAVAALGPARRGWTDSATHTYTVCMTLIIDVQRDAVEGIWRVMKQGGARASARKDTQEMAKQAAIGIASRTGGIVRVWNRHGGAFKEITIRRS